MVKTGNGTLTLTASNTYSGGTTITGGIVALGTYDGGNENGASLGSGSVSISNAQITFGGTAGGTVVTTTIANNFSVNGGVFFGQDGYQNLTGTVTIGPGGLTAYTQWGNKDVALGQLAGSGPLVIDSTIAAGSTQGVAGGIVHVSGSAGYTGTVTINPAGVAAAGRDLRHRPWRRVGGRLGRCLDRCGGRHERHAGDGLRGRHGHLRLLSGSGAIGLPTTVFPTVGGLNTSTTYSGVLSGGGGLAMVGNGMLTLTGSNVYTGGLTVSAGTVQLGSSTATLGANNSSLTVNALVDLDGNSAIVGGLSGSGLITNVAGGGAVTLTIGSGGGSGAFSGTLANGSGTLSLVVAGGTQVFSGTNTYSGGTLLSGGILNFASSAALGSYPPSITFNGGTLQYAANNTFDVSPYITQIASGVAAIIDTGTNSVVFNSPVSGSGGLTKAGPARLL